MNERKVAAKRVNIVSLKLVKEASVLYKPRYINSPHDAAQLITPFIAELDREKVIVICLDVKNQPTTIATVSVGNLSSSLVHPREVFKTAILANAAGIVVAHNHPSGDLTPSKDDINVTKRLQKAGEILGVDILDHVIVGPNQGYISFREQRLL